MRVDKLLASKPFCILCKGRNLIKATLQVTIQTAPRRHKADSKIKNNKGRHNIQYCSFCGTEAALSYLARPEYSSFSDKAYKLFADRGSTNKSATFSLLGLSLSPCDTSLSSVLPSISHFGISDRNYPLCLQWAPGYSFLPGNGKGHESARRGALLQSSPVPCTLVPTSFFSRTVGVLSYQNSLTHNIH